MFLLVDIVQKKTKSRNIVALAGLAYTFPGIKLIIWLILILFSGFPITVKFSIEWQLLSLLANQANFFMVFIFFIVIVFGIVGFAKQMFILLYGMARNELEISNTVSKRDKYL